jgi:membrane-associated protease RseP (regulator of RpoE activity)
MMKILALIFLWTLPLVAQFHRPQQMPEDGLVTEQQTHDFFKTARAVTGKPSELVVPIYSFRDQIASGVSLGEGVVLSKLSDVVNRKRLLFYTPETGAKPIKFLGAYPEHDLVLLYAEGLKIQGVEWQDSSDLAEGSFLLAVRHDGEAEGIGVKSVAARSLREEEQGFLGVRLDPRLFGKGVEILGVTEASAAAKAGMRAGDRVVSINGQEVKGFHELSTQLKRLRAGEKPEIVVLRGSEKLTLTPTLDGNPVSQVKESKRLSQMQGGDRSAVRDDFPNVMQSDMELSANDVGLPVVDLDSRIVGMVIARAGRISTLILPGELIREVLQEEPMTKGVDAARDETLKKLRARYAE